MMNIYGDKYTVWPKKWNEDLLFLYLLFPFFLVSFKHSKWRRH